MASDLKKVIENLRTRAEGLGYTVHQKTHLDPQSDDLPGVIVTMGADGDQPGQRRPQPIDRVQLIVELWIETDGDWFTHLAEERSKFIETIFPKESSGSDRVDTLDGAALKVERQKTMIVAHPEIHDVGLLQVVAQIQYTE